MAAADNALVDDPVVARLNETWSRAFPITDVRSASFLPPRHFSQSLSM